MHASFRSYIEIISAQNHPVSRRNTAKNCNILAYIICLLSRFNLYRVTLSNSYSTDTPSVVVYY